MTDGAAVDQEIFAISFARSGPLATPVAGPYPAGNDDFIIGPENRLAGAVITQWCAEGRGCYSPVMLWGASGTGKSHLVRNFVQARDNLVCVQAADFAREYAAATATSAVATEAVAKFQTRYRMAELFVLEDLTELSGHPGALAELQHTLDFLELREVPVLITSRLPLAEIKGLPPALRSRLSSGLVTSLVAPGPKAREVILQRIALARGIAITADAARLLAERLSVTAGKLWAALLELEMTQRAGSKENCAVDVNQVRQFLAKRQLKFRPTLKQICAAVAKVYGLKSEALVSASRHRQIALARSVAIYLGRVTTGLSLQALGRHFGGRDHTTALHSCRTIQQRMLRDRQLRNVVDALQKQLSL